MSPEARSLSPGLQPLSRRFLRNYFVWLGLFSSVITVSVFLPGLIKFVAGKFPVPWVLSVHGVLMLAWLALFLAQAVFAAKGRLATHEKLGQLGMALGPLVWLSMVFVELRRKLVYPLAPDLAEDYDSDLPGIYIWSTFLFYFACAIYQRRRWPDWHKRFMVFAALVVVQAAEMRISWLPLPLPGYWNDAIYLDCCLLIPLLAYDYTSAKRLHPATVVATTVLLSAQGLLLWLWGSPGWRHFAYGFTVALRSHF